MLHPSYMDLIEVANKHVEEGEQPVISSRYSVILAAAKRARQLVEGADPLVHGNEKKPLSVAIDELAEDQIHILSYNPEENGAGAHGETLPEDEISDAAAEEGRGEEMDAADPEEAAGDDTPEDAAEESETEEE